VAVASLGFLSLRSNTATGHFSSLLRAAQRHSGLAAHSGLTANETRLVKQVSREFSRMNTNRKTSLEKSKLVLFFDSRLFACIGD
jgi:hypothetical protein